MKCLKISYQKHKIDSLLLSSRCMTNYIVHENVFILHANFTETMKAVKNLFTKKLEKHIYRKKICCRCIPTTYVAENKENYFEIYTF